MILICRISNADKNHFMYAPVTKVNSKSEKVQNRDEFLKKRLLLIPEFVKIHPLPGSLWREIQMFGFIITRLTQFMNLDVFMNELSKAGPFYSRSYKKVDQIDHNVKVNEIIEPKNFKTNEIDLMDILNAVTLKGAGEKLPDNSDFDMERLEILGDSFLKFFVTLGLFCNKVQTTKMISLCSVQHFLFDFFFSEHF